MFGPIIIEYSFEISFNFIMSSSLNISNGCNIFINLCVSNSLLCHEGEASDTFIPLFFF